MFQAFRSDVLSALSRQASSHTKVVLGRRRCDKAQRSSLRSEAMMIPYIWKMNCWDISDCKCMWVRCIVNVLRWNPLGNWMKSYAWRFYLCFLNSSVFSYLFALASIRIFSLALFYITFYIYSPWEVLKRMWYGLEYSGSRFLFTENRNKKLLTFLMGFVLKFAMPTLNSIIYSLLTLLK